MKKALYTNFTPYFIHTAKLMKQEGLCEPSYWLINEKQMPVAQAEFPECEFHLFKKAIKGFQPEGNEYNLVGLIDEPLLEEHAYAESIVMDMMNRNDVTNNYSYYERKKVYKHYLSMAFTVLDKHNPDIAFFTEEPHQPFIYVLYRECVRRGIETQMFTRTSFLKRMVALRRFEDGPVFLKNKPEQFEPCNLEDFPEDIVDVVKRMRGDYALGMPSYMKWQYEKFDSSNSKLKSVIRKVSRNLNPATLKNNWDRLNEEILTSQNHKDKGFFQTKIKRKDLRQWIQEVDSKNNELRDYYESIANTNPNLSGRYILFTLHYQPEISTSPQGLQYVDQLLVAELLARLLPKGWKLFIKEHLSQLVLTLFGNQTRSKEYYDRLRALPNTELIPLKFPSFDLIDQCSATAAITGTVVFEGIVRGKPGIHFGLSWYNGCYGTRFARSSKDILEFFRFVSEFEYNEKKLFGYLKWFAENTFKGTIGNKQTEKQGFSQKQNGELHFKAIKSLIG